MRKNDLELFLEYRNNTNRIGIRNQLVERNRKLVYLVAHQILDAKKCDERFDDLAQVGTIGLIKAVERFDPTKGHQFSSYAIPAIRGEILHHIRDKVGVVRTPRRWHDLLSRANTWQRKAGEKSDREIADYLKISLEEWGEICKTSKHWGYSAPLDIEGSYQAKEGVGIVVANVINLPKIPYKCLSDRERKLLKAFVCDRVPCREIDAIFRTGWHKEINTILYKLTIIMTGRSSIHSLSSIQLRILQLFLKYDELTSSICEQELALSSPRLARMNLSQLEELSFIQSRKQGRNKVFRLTRSLSEEEIEVVSAIDTIPLVSETPSDNWTALIHAMGSRILELEQKIETLIRPQAPVIPPELEREFLNGKRTKS